MTPEELNQLKAIAASCDMQKRLNELIAQQEPKRKKRDGFREPDQIGTRFFLIRDEAVVNEDRWDNVKIDRERLALGNCFEHRHNAEMVAEQNRLMASFTRWIDEHGAEARSNPFAHIYKDPVTGDIASSEYGVHFLGTPTTSPNHAAQFIRENEADLKKYFENEETLRRTLYE